jgi:ATPase subunit of ABC transporter with duplicated ATPase domains
MGKSTLLKIMANEIDPLEGNVNIQGDLFYVPQMFGNFNDLTVAECLKIDKKLDALQKITSGEVDEIYFETLNDDWDIEERCQNALQYWKLENLDLNQKLERLSGGQKQKFFWQEFKSISLKLFYWMNRQIISIWRDEICCMILLKKRVQPL